MLINTVPSGASALIEKLPQHLAHWQRDKFRMIDESNIFEYMAGSGELYLAYRLDHVQVTEYITAAESWPDILVQVYKMQTDQDAFGLLSLDWDGEPVKITHAPPGITPKTVPLHRALYGAGLLRAWAGTFFFRIMAYPESDIVKTQIFSLARILTKDLLTTGYPDLLNALSLKLGAFYLLKNKVHFFRSYLVLNSLYFLAQDNILYLDRDCQAVLAFYRSDCGQTIPGLIIQYPESNLAHRALASFVQALFADQPGSNDYFTQTGEGWIGCTQDKNHCYITFEHSCVESAQQFLQQLRRGHD